MDGMDKSKIGQMTKEEILSMSLIEEIYTDENIIARAENLVSLRLRATELKVVRMFDKLVKALEQAEKQMRAEERQSYSNNCYLDGITGFESDGKYPNLRCPGWIANESGISLADANPNQKSTLACYHPILPVERLRNMQTGEERITLAYKQMGHWQEVTVSKLVIASSNKIVSLASFGIAVTSETSKNLVRFLADVENCNQDLINIKRATSKFGWYGNNFIPYDKDIIFDVDISLRPLADSIRTEGDYDIWLEHVKELRKVGRIETAMVLAASFASVLVRRLNVLPFIVDLWGTTGGGKTIALMLAVSVWGNPNENNYIGDFKNTAVALEVKADMLNNLPLILDDTSNRNKRIEDNFESLIYSLCSGKGKTRSNKELGLNKEHIWQNCVLTSGESPLNGFAGQGGAINRIIEINANEDIFDDFIKTVGIVKGNYGHAGKLFIEAVKALSKEELAALQTSLLDELKDDENTLKQAISLSVILTADRLIEKHIFKDGCLIDIDKARELLLKKSEIDDNVRAYEYLESVVFANSFRFNSDVNMEQWGVMDEDEGYVYFYTRQLEKILQEGNYSKNSFLNWTKRQNISLTDHEGYNSIRKRINGKRVRVNAIKFPSLCGDDEDSQNSGDSEFVPYQGVLPFN